MSSEVFRFVTVRPPLDVDSIQAATNATIDLGAWMTQFADSLRTLKASVSRAQMSDAARAFIASADFIDLTVSDRKELRAKADALEDEIRRAVGPDNFFITPPPVTKEPKFKLPDKWRKFIDIFLDKGAKKPQLT